MSISLQRVGDGMNTNFHALKITINSAVLECDKQTLNSTLCKSLRIQATSNKQ